MGAEPVGARGRSGSAVGIVVLFPELLGTYGDGGNSVVAAQRLRWRGIDAEIVTVSGGDPVPESADLYLLGGGEDGPQSLAATTLATGGGLGRAVERGAAVLAVCAGFQILGRTFIGPGGGQASGLGLIDCTTTRGAGPRRVGEIVVEAATHLHLPVLSGYENHSGVTALGPEATPLGAVTVGRGNDAGGGSLTEADEGAVTGHIVATYLHGPVLARNPALADMILSWIVGEELAPLDVAEVDELRRERLAAATSTTGRRRRFRLDGHRRQGKARFVP